MKLYTVRIEVEFMAFAASEEDACDLVNQFLQHESIGPDDCEVVSAGPNAHAPPDWDDGALVYGPAEDLTLADARRLSKP